MQSKEVFLNEFANIIPYNSENISTEEYIVRLAAVALEVPVLGVAPLQRDVLIDAILPTAFEDLSAYHERDPSVRRKPVSCLISPHSTFFAVLCHRIARQLMRSADGSDNAAERAMRLCFYARSQTGIEIHPEARIGRRFVVDHGWGTIIGQTAEIGDDCYILNDVTLGGRIVANAPDGKRHPTIGNRVQICARAKIFGPVIVGDDCFVGPDVTVTADVPAGARVLNTLAQEVDVFAATLHTDGGHER